MSTIRIILFALIMFAASNVLCAQNEGATIPVPNPAIRGAVGIGSGIPYGGLGLHGEFNLLPYIALTAGIGTMLTQTGYAAGLKFTLLSPDHILRPNAAILWGVNGNITARDEGLPHINEAQHGFTGALGAQWMFGNRLNHGFVVQIVYNITTTMYDRIEELELEGYGPFTKGSRFAYAAGYRYAF